MQPVNPQLTRRRFIKGVIASGAVAGTTSLWYAANGQSRPAGAVERMIRLNVNGQDRTVDVAPQETLASTLRYKLGLTGTKLGCNRGECGACTVLVDDVPTYACSVLTHSFKDGRIETVEGLEAPDGTLHPVQPRAAGIRRRARSSMRLLHAGPGDGGGRTAAGKPESHPGRSADGHGGQYLPLRLLRLLPRRRHARR